MLAALPSTIEVREITVEQARNLLAEGLESAVGHADTAAVFSNVLGLPVATNRATVSLSKGDMVVVGQYRGPRLSEGAKTLPADATIQWVVVRVSYD